MRRDVGRPRRWPTDDARAKKPKDAAPETIGGRNRRLFSRKILGVRHRDGDHFGESTIGLGTHDSWGTGYAKTKITYAIDPACSPNYDLRWSYIGSDRQLRDRP